jgi:multiple antibiotic resistance protein
MLQVQHAMRQKGEHICFRRETRLLLALTVGFGFLIHAGIASAAEAAPGPVPLKHIPVTQIFTFLFLMLGPFKIIGPFAKITKGADAGFTRQIALRASLFASLAILVAAFIGETFLSKYGIPLPILALSAGIILFLVALQNILQQFAPNDAESTLAPPPPTLNVALSPLAFPTIVTPYGIAAVVVFLALSPDLQGRLVIGAILLAIMLLNLVVMLLTRHIGRVLGVVLQILGAVLGVIQVALGLLIIHNSLQLLWT